eukprot:s2769_g18.t1
MRNFRYDEQFPTVSQKCRVVLTLVETYGLMTGRHGSSSRPPTAGYRRSVAGHFTARQRLVKRNSTLTSTNLERNNISEQVVAETRHR